MDANSQIALALNHIANFSAATVQMNLHRFWTETLAQRLTAFDIHPTAPLWGEGELRSSGPAQATGANCAIKPTR